MTTQTTVVPAGKKRRPARRPAATDGSLDDFFDMSSSAGPKPPKKLKKKPTMNSAATLTPSTSDDLSKNPASAGGPVQVDVTSCEPLPVNDEALTSLPEKPKQDGPEYDGTVTPPPACFAAGTDNLVRLQCAIPL